LQRRNSPNKWASGRAGRLRLTGLGSGMNQHAFTFRPQENSLEKSVRKKEEEIEMSLETSQKIVRVLGIIGIIVGALAVVGGFGMLGLGGVGIAGATTTPDDNLAMGIGVVFFLGIVMLVSGIVDILEGVFALRAAKDASKAMPLWIFAIIGLVLSVLSLITGITNGSGSLLSDLVSVALNGGFFYLANNIKNYGA
jgi:hypothetical protein